MLLYAAILYGLLLLLLVMFLRKWSGKSLDALLDERTEDHHKVHRVITEHPCGGHWTEHKKWLDKAGGH